jgi:Asp-tRNA(Asn)/Glu-tRNA(Gln) amidotransferase A subunit family amidase
VSIPAVRSADGVPVGLSLMGWAGGDEALLNLAHILGPYCKAS